MPNDLICGLLVVVEKVATGGLNAGFVVVVEKVATGGLNAGFVVVVVVASLRSISRGLWLLRRNKGVQAFSCLVVEKEACDIRASLCLVESREDSDTV